jgi:DNA polymerase III delta prime subunit
MIDCFLKKYKCKKYKDFIINKQFIQLLYTIINSNNINILFIGNRGTGKSCLINSTIREYYNTEKIPLQNVLYINNLKDQGIQYYRNEVKTFCQIKSDISGKKKFVVLDDIDNINEQSQQVFRNCIDKYSKNVNFISSCTNSQKVIESLQSRFLILKINPISIKLLKSILNKIKTNENIKFDENVSNFLITICNNSIRLLINYLEKFKLIDSNISINNAKNICTNISFLDYETYTNYWYKEKNIEKSIQYIFNIFYKGYSVMDILDNYFSFIKITNIIPENIKYKIIKIICKYISIFHTEHEYDIELAFFTNELIKNI